VISESEIDSENLPSELRCLLRPYCVRASAKKNPVATAPGSDKGLISSEEAVPDPRFGLNVLRV
jgi:hypothetical protein